MSALLALSMLLQAAPEWWNAEWRFRRQVSLRNNLGKTLEKGHPVSVELDLEYLELDRKSLKNLADLRLVHKNRSVPFMLMKDPSSEHHKLWFRTAEALPAGAADHAYALYYGNPSAPAAGPASVFDLFEDFSTPTGFREHFESEGGLGLTVEKGALRITPEAATATNLHPARLAFSKLPRTDGFSLEFDLEIETPADSPLEFAVHVDLEEPGAETPEALAKRINGLIAELGNDDGEVREKATEELIRIGRPALKQVEAATHSPDAEVKWRAVIVLRRIREAAPAPTIRAGVLLGDRRIGPLALVHTIGRSVGKVSRRIERPVKFHIQVVRDSGGNVTLTWNRRDLQRGSLPGKIRRISFTCRGPSPSPKTSVRIDNIRLGGNVDDEKRPTYSIQIEETRP